MKSVYKLLGIFFVGLAILGVVLPLLPTTPFLLLAAGCFAKSSERWYRWLLSNATFGPMIRDWEENRCIQPRVKVIALVSMIGVGGTSILFFVDMLAVKIIGLVLIAIGAWVVSRLKTCPT
ncbi:MAG: YbaN family protein [Pseudomonadota bacterium]